MRYFCSLKDQVHWESCPSEHWACFYFYSLPCLFLFPQAFCPCSKFPLLAPYSNEPVPLRNTRISSTWSKGSCRVLAIPWICMWPGQAPTLANVCHIPIYSGAESLFIMCSPVMVIADSHWDLKNLLSLLCYKRRLKLRLNKQREWESKQSIPSPSSTIWSSSIQILRSRNILSFYEHFSSDININKIHSHGYCCWKTFFLVTVWARNIS